MYWGDSPTVKVIILTNHQLGYSCTDAAGYTTTTVCKSTTHMHQT